MRDNFKIYSIKTSPLAVSALLLMIVTMVLNAPCDEMSFPKFIGGLIGDTFINQIDVSESTDAIAAVGKT